MMKKRENNIQLMDKEFKVTKKEGHDIYLTEDEIKQIHPLDFLNNFKIDRTRYLFKSGFKP